MLDLSTEQLLAERGKTHGDFAEHALVTQTLKRFIGHDLFAEAVFRERITTGTAAVMQEAMDMTLHKIGRIVAGDCRVIDHWADIAGYNELVVQHLRKVASEKG